MQSSFEINTKNYLIAGTIVFLIGLYFCLFQEVNRDDETWFLQVVNRVLQGEVLYRDVYLGVFPLSVYTTALFCWPFGAELVIARGVLALYFTVGVLLACAILKELKVTSRFSLCFIFSFFVFSHFQSSWGYSGYNGLAKVFFLACFLYALKGKLSIAGICSGLCFCAKQNVGLIAFFVLLAISAAAIVKKQLTIKEGIKKAGYASLAFSLVVAICFFAVFLQGGHTQLIDYAFLNKTRYLHADHTPYFLIPSNWDSYTLFIFAFPVLFILAFLISFPHLKKEKGMEPFIVLLFFAGSLLNLFPRADNPQKMTFIPFALITLCYLCNKIAHFEKAVKVFGCWVVLFFTLLLSSQFKEFMDQPRKTAKITHFHRIYLKPSEYLHWKSLKENFLAQHNGDPIFFLSTHCGFYYLLFDIHNPTPYDYPIHPALGCRGEEEIVQKIASRHIAKVYMDLPNLSNWETQLPDRHPLHLEAFLNHHMSTTINPYFVSFSDPSNP